MPEAVHEILRHVKEIRAVDFNAYNANTVKRRLALRMGLTGKQDYALYLDYLKETPEEMDALIDALTIKVSCFFRNPLVFELLREYVLPELMDAHREEGLRVWSAGCARGEEAYSTAIIIKEIAEKENISSRAFILATDIDREALNDAIMAGYADEALSEVKKGCLDRHFVPQAGLYMLKEEITSMVNFAFHDVTILKSPKEGIFSDYHIILCRNVLIYFNSDLQKKVIGYLSALIPVKGCLVLGEAETLPEGLRGHFNELMPGSKIFRKEG
jgi:chemotaxis methyl-accepting protein methylase